MRSLCVCLFRGFDFKYRKPMGSDTHGIFNSFGASGCPSHHGLHYALSIRIVKEIISNELKIA